MLERISTALLAFNGVGGAEVRGTLGDDCDMNDEAEEVEARRNGDERALGNGLLTASDVCLVDGVLLNGGAACNGRP